MLEAVYIAVILGCTDDLVGCRRISSVEEGWASEAACEASIPAILEDNTAADFPMLAGVCERAGDPLIAGQPPAAGARPAG